MNGAAGRVRGCCRSLAGLGWTAGAALVFALFLRISLEKLMDSDGANNALQAWDMLHGNLVLHGWIVGDVTFYTFELPLIAILEFFLGLHADTMHVAEALVYVIVAAFAVAIAVTDSRGLSRVIRASVVVAALAAPTLVRSDLWIPLGIPDHTGTTVFLLASFLLVDRGDRPPLDGAAALPDLVRRPDQRRDRALRRGARHRRGVPLPGAGRRGS